MDPKFRKELRKSVEAVCHKRAIGLKTIGALPADYQVTESYIDVFMTGLEQVYEATLEMERIKAAVEQEAQRESKSAEEGPQSAEEESES